MWKRGMRSNGDREARSGAAGRVPEDPGLAVVDQPGARAGHEGGDRRATPLFYGDLPDHQNM